jgi:CBS domain-containing protein
MMEDAVMKADPKASAMAVAELLSEHHFGSVPVVEADGTLRGLVTEFDLLKTVEQGRDLREVRVMEIMTREVVTTTENTPLMDLIHLLQERHPDQSTGREGKHTHRHRRAARCDSWLCESPRDILAVREAPRRTD